MDAVDRLDDVPAGDEYAQWVHERSLLGAGAEPRSSRFVLGESFGGSVVQGSAWRSGADGAVAISGPPQIAVGAPGKTNDLDGFAGVPRLKVPLLVLISRGDHRRTPVGEMRRLVRGHGRLIVYPGYYHASDLLFEAPYRERVRATLIAFLRNHG